MALFSFWNWLHGHQILTETWRQFKHFCLISTSILIFIVWFHSTSSQRMNAFFTIFKTFLQNCIFLNEGLVSGTICWEAEVLWKCILIICSNFKICSSINVQAYLTAKNIHSCNQRFAKNLKKRISILFFFISRKYKYLKFNNCYIIKSYSGNFIDFWNLNVFLDILIVISKRSYNTYIKNYCTHFGCVVPSGLFNKCLIFSQENACMDFGILYLFKLQGCLSW